MPSFKARELAYTAAERTLERIREARANAPSRLKPILRDLEINFFHPSLKIKDLYRALGNQDRSLSEYFQINFGLSPSTYIRECRLATAAELLRDTELPVGRVGLVTGYEDPSIFCHTFKKWCGLSPKSFRKVSKKILTEVGPPPIDLLRVESLTDVIEGRLPLEKAKSLIQYLNAIYHLEEDVQSTPRTFPTEKSVLYDEIAEEIKAQKVWEFLRDLPWREQQEMIRNRFIFLTPALFHLLRYKSRTDGRKNRGHGVVLAELALESLRITEKRRGKPLLVLRAQGLAWLGNARRLAFDFVGAEEAFSRAEAHLAGAESEPLIQAEINELKAALRWWQRRFTDALELNSSALSVFRSIGEPKQIAESLILRFEIHHHAGDSAAGIPFLEEALQIAERLDSHYLVIIAHYNLAASHVKMGAFREAEESLKKLRGLYNIEISQAIAWHARWLDGAIRRGLGDFQAAETCFMEARHGFLEADQLGYVAQVGLDLALLYSEQERSSDVRRIVMEILPAFSALRVSREATVALELLRNATMGAEIPYALLQEIRVHMEKIRLDPTFQFKQPIRESN